MSPSVSVIIPALDEEATLAGALRSVRRAVVGVEVLTVDGGSRDGTAAVARQLGGELRRRGVESRLLTCPAGRARQMNHGARHARGAALLFLHADTLLPPGAADAVAAALEDSRVVGGAFHHAFHERRLSLRLVSLGSNLRARLGGALYGDQAIFIRRSAFEQLGGFRPLPMLEDADLSRRMRSLGRRVLLPLAVRTSGRRFLVSGVARTVFRMQRIKLLYRQGRDLDGAAADYWRPSRRGTGRRASP